MQRTLLHGLFPTVRAEVLRLLFTNPKQELYVRELARLSFRDAGSRLPPIIQGAAFSGPPVGLRLTGRLPESQFWSTSRQRIAECYDTTSEA
jgi:hypothetical protein